MAEAVLYICSGCAHAIEACDDGNPYYINKKGVKQYAYHPDHKRLAKCIGNDSPYLCLQCATTFTVDSRAPVTICPKCGAAEIKDTYQLEGVQCPYCREGIFVADQGFHCIS